MLDSRSSILYKGSMVRQNAALRKSVRSYLADLKALDLCAARSDLYQRILNYLRSLYGEYGRAAVRAEVERQRERP